MHYYTFNIEDYTASASRLTMMEDSAYRRLIDAYFLAEAPIEDKKKYIIAGARSEDERAAVDLVLEIFFRRDGEVWRQERCDRDIRWFHENKEAKSRGGKASAAKKVGKSENPPFEPKQDQDLLKTSSTPVQDLLKTSSERCSSKQITNNNKLITNNQEQVLEEGGVGGENLVETKSSAPPLPKPRERPAWFDEIQPEEGILRLVVDHVFEFKDKRGGYMFEPDSFVESPTRKLASKLAAWAEPDWLEAELERMGLWVAKQKPGHRKVPHLFADEWLGRCEAEQLRVQRQRRIDAEMEARNAQRNAPDDDWKRQFHVMAGGSA